MKRNVFLFLLIVLWLPLMAQRAAYGKMSRWVREVAVGQAVGPLRVTAASNVDKHSPRMTAFVRAEGDADSVFQANDCEVLLRRGDIYIVSVPVSRLAPLSRYPNVKRIESGRGNRLHMDITPGYLGATAAYQGQNLPQAFTGKGVMVGVMDIGFDLTHPNFYDSSATHYRIRSLWDQLSTDTVGSPHPVGRSYHGTEALLALQHSRDGLDQTHGTHTLGILAGSGYDSPYRGMAYESDICIVANATTEDAALIDTADYYKYTYATDALGFKYIFDTADSLGMPCVVSFSEGSDQDFRGDDQLYYAMLDSLTGPGHIIVSSAGNEGQVPTYIHKPVGRASAGCFAGAYTDRISFTLNCLGDAQLRTVFYADSGNDTLTISTRDVLQAADSVLTDTAMVGGRELYITAVGYGNCYAPWRLVLDVELRTADRFSSLGKPSVEIVGEDADVELFRNQGYLYTSERNPELCDADCSHTVNSPSSAPSVICVGSSSYRTSFVNYLGEERIYDMGTGGQRGAYSSAGPTFDGRTKPDVLAPGTNIISSYSSFYLENHPTAGDISCDVAHFDFNGRTYAWNSNSGTSMASPAAAGAIALWLQANPRLTPSDVLGIIARTSTHYDPSLTYPNNLYGYGQINAYAGLLDILGISSVREISHTVAEGVAVSPLDGGRIRIDFAEPLAEPVTVSAYSLSGASMHSETIGSGVQSVVITVAAAGKNIVALQIGDRGSQLVRMR